MSGYTKIEPLAESRSSDLCVDCTSGERKLDLQSVLDKHSDK